MVDGVRGAGRGTFGQPVPFEDLDSCSAEEVREPRIQGAGSGNGVAQLPAEHGPKLRVQQAVEEAMAQPEREPRPSRGPVRGPGFERLGVGHGGFFRCREDSRLSGVGGLLSGGGVDFLENPRHGQQECRLECRQVLQQLFGHCGVGQPDSASKAHHLHGPSQHMRQRQEHEGARTLRLE